MEENVPYGFDPDALRTTGELEEIQNAELDAMRAEELQANAAQMEQEVEAGEKAGPPGSANTTADTEEDPMDEIPANLRVAEDEMPAWRRAMEEEAPPIDRNSASWNLQERVAEKDAKAPEDFNAMDDLIEFADSASQGVMRGLHSVVTAPERLKDMMDGSYDRQVAENGFYEPTGTYNLIPGMEWVGDQGQNPNLAKTKWGQLVSELTKTAVIGGSVYVTGGAAGVPMATTAGVMGTAGIEGLIDEDSATRDTVTTGVTKLAPFLQYTPQSMILANGAEDSALVRTLRNSLEQVGFAGVGDIAARAFGNKLKNAAASRTAQIQEKAMQQLDLDTARINFDPEYKPQFQGYKNKPLADEWQGNAFSQGGIGERVKQSQQKAINSRGSTASSISPSEVTQVVTGGKTIDLTLDRTVKELLGDDGIARIVRENPGMEQAQLNQMFDYAFKRQQEVLGRNLDGLTPEEFWAPIAISNIDDVQAWSLKEIVAADLVNAELFSQVRDTAVGMREIIDFADVMDVDGPMKTLTDRLKMGLTNVERSRSLWKSIQSGSVEQWTKNSEAIAEQAAKSVSFRIDAITKSLNSGATDDQVKAFVEMVAGMDDITNFGDLDEYFKFKLRNGKEGLLYEELGGVYVNSVLSGPRTPLKAIVGTTAAAYIDSFEGVAGAALPALFGNVKAQKHLRASLGGLNAMNQTLGEAFTIFNKNLNAYLKQDVVALSNRFPMKTAQKQKWEALGAWIKTGENVTLGDKAAYAIMDIGYKLNNNSIMTYANSIMTASDDAWRPLLARNRARTRAWRAAIDDEAADALTDSLEDVVARYESRFYDELMDSNGRLDFSKDAVLESMYQRATLTEPLVGFNKDLDEVMKAYPLTRPMYMFARTGISDLRYQTRKIPLVSALLDQERAIAMATADNLDGVIKYGINNATDLEAAKFAQAGRFGIGMGITFGGIQAYQQGRLSGDGPMDPQIRQTWIDAGWEPGRLTIPTAMGDVSLDLEQLGGFGLLLRNIANVGDNIELMGEKWGQNEWATIGHSIAATATSKLAVSNLGDFANIFTKPEKFLERTLGNILNNQVPLAGARNELGNILTPYQREINSGIIDSIRNRNKATENIAAEPLPIKYDLLEYKPLKNYNFWQRAFNAVNPLGLRVDDTKSPGRKLLMNSNYDLTPTFFRHQGVDMTEDKYVRAMFREAFSKQNVINDLDILAERPDVQASVAQMHRDARGPHAGDINATGYMHNALIKQVMDKAKNKAWASIQSDPRVQALIDEKMTNDKINNRATKLSRNPSLSQQAETILEQTPTR